MKKMRPPHPPAGFLRLAGMAGRLIKVQHSPFIVKQMAPRAAPAPVKSSSSAPALIDTGTPLLAARPGASTPAQQSLPLS